MSACNNQAARQKSASFPQARSPPPDLGPQRPDLDPHRPNPPGPNPPCAQKADGPRARGGRVARARAHRPRCAGPGAQRGGQGLLQYVPGVPPRALRPALRVSWSLRVCPRRWAIAGASSVCHPCVVNSGNSLLMHPVAGGRRVSIARVPHVLARARGACMWAARERARASGLRLSLSTRSAFNAFPRSGFLYYRHPRVWSGRPHLIGPTSVRSSP